jgi:hypothetical protein
MALASNPRRQRPHCSGESQLVRILVVSISMTIAVEAFAVAHALSHFFQRTVDAQGGGSVGFFHGWKLAIRNMPGGIRQADLTFISNAQITTLAK